MASSSTEQQTLEERIKELEAKFDLVRKEQLAMRAAVVIAYAGIIYAITIR